MQVERTSSALKKASGALQRNDTAIFAAVSTAVPCIVVAAVW
jgi:hypothetical protein